MSNKDEENIDFDERVDELKISLMIKLVRHALGLSLKEMGEYLGVGASTVGKWENMELTIKAPSLLRLQRLIKNAGIECTLHDEDLTVCFSKATLKWMVEDLATKRSAQGSPQNNDSMNKDQLLRGETILRGQL